MDVCILILLVIDGNVNTGLQFNTEFQAELQLLFFEDFGGGLLNGTTMEGIGHLILDP